MPRWIRVRDVTTGHQFDIEERALRRRQGVEPLNDPRWPDLVGPHVRPRAAKPFVGKDGKPATPGSVRPTSETESTPDDATSGEPSGDAAPRSRRATTTRTPAAEPADTSKEQ